MKIVSVVGARPNFVKIAPILRALKQYREINCKLVHTGQHYDNYMSKVFFEDLEIPPPDMNLEIGSGSHAGQIGRIMIRLEEFLEMDRPDLMLVVGDVNSTLAAAITAAKLNIPIAHVEAGLRSFDRMMPEEINRICTDAVAELFFTTSLHANHHLQREGIAAEQIHFVGNVMIDSLYACLKKAQQHSSILDRLGLREKEYGLLTLHRPTNVDQPEILREILDAVEVVSQNVSLVFPVHPRTQQRLQQFGLQERLNQMSPVIQTPPLGYLDFLRLLSTARFALIDSSGAQEETTVLGIPCLTMRETTERPETVLEGTNLLVGHDAKKIVESVDSILAGKVKGGQIPEQWDGKAAQRIAKILIDWWQAKQAKPPALPSVLSF